MKNLFALAALALTTCTAPAHAQENCAPYEKVIQILDEQYNEGRIGRGLDTHGNLLEVYASAAGTWTIVVIFPADGRACVVVSGEAWAITPLLPLGQNG